jgi:hypothetical protein
LRRTRVTRKTQQRDGRARSVTCFRQIRPLDALFSLEKLVRLR